MGRTGNKMRLATLSILVTGLEAQSIFDRLTNITSYSESTPDPNLPILRSRRRGRNRNNPTSNGPTLFQVLNAIKVTSQYGCWCTSEDNWSESRGTPVDQMDHLCKGYVQAMKCLQMDVGDVLGELASEECNPLTTKYKTAGFNFMKVGEIEIEEIREKCGIANQGDLCKTNVCIVDVAMLPNVWHILKRGSDFIIEANFRHQNGFDRKVECGFQKEASKGAGASADVTGVEGSVGGDENDLETFRGRDVECCGAQPFRKPYKTQNGNRQCCAAANLAYDATKFTCCDSGEIKVACD